MFSAPTQASYINNPGCDVKMGRMSQISGLAGLQWLPSGAHHRLRDRGKGWGEAWVAQGDLAGQKCRHDFGVFDARQALI